MLRRISFITAFALLFISLVAVPMTSEAYISTDNLFTACVFSSVKNCSLKPAYDGVYIIQTSYKSSYSPDIINSPVRLDKTQFLSGTWNGQTINELDSQYLYNIDVTGFSQTVSYSDEKDYFVYSLVTCLPVKAGDDFNIIFNINSANVKESSHSTVISYIPGGTGCRMVHSENGTSHSENPLSYTVSSSNQHIALVFNPDTFNTDYVNTGFSRSFSNRVNCETVSGLNFVGMHSKSFDIFTTSYNYTGDISVTLKDSIDNYSFSVYEIFTDGTVTPGYNTEVEQPTSDSSDDDGNHGGGGSHRYEEENSKGILDTVKEIFSNLKDIAGTVFDIPQHIENLGKNFKQYLEELFIPSDNNNFTKIKVRIETKFGFISQIITFLQDFNKIVWTDEPLDTKINFSSAHNFDPDYNFEVNFINLELYDKYKPTVDALIIFISYFFFIRRLLQRLPGIIGGFGL